MASAFATFDIRPAAERPAAGCRIGRPREVDFRALVGRPAWFQLPLAVRRRFEAASHAAAGHGAPTLYPGAMELRASPLGWLFTHACRLIGTPLAPGTGAEVPVMVEVYGDGRGGIVWGRTYCFPGRAPVLVASRKVADADGGLMEVTRGGLGMTLTATVEDQALHLRSTGYFIEIAGRRLPIPELFTPGAAHVIHADEGGGAFRFTLSFKHRLAGETLYQSGIFRDPAGEGTS